MMYIIGLIVIGFLLSFLRFLPKNEKVKKQINEQIIRQDKLNQLIKENVIEKSKTYINNDFTKAIVLDEINNKIHLFNVSNYQCFTHHFKDLIKSEVIIDNDTIISTKKGNQILGAVVGDIIAGVPGMIIGALSSEKITSQKVNHIDLKLTLNDMNNPIFKINFLSPSVNGFMKDSPQVRNALTSIDKWQGYFNVILRQQNTAI